MNRHEAELVVPRAARRLFAVGVWTLPPRLRSLRGEDMRELFEDLFREAAGRSRLAATRFALVATVRAVAAGIRARFTGKEGPERQVPGGAAPGAGWGKDIAYALRGIRRDPGFAVVVILTLGLAIGVNSTIFSLGRTMIFIPIPFADQASLIAIRADNPSRNIFRAGVSAPDLLDIAEQVDSVAGVAAFDRDVTTLDADGGVTRVATMVINEDFFAVTGLPLHAGRTFLAEEHASEAAVVLLSHGAWERRFGGEPMVGSTVQVAGSPHVVVGIVAPEVSRGWLRSVELWRPLRIAAESDRANRNLSVFARLAPGATLERAALETEGVAEILSREHPASNDGWRMTALSLQAALVGPNALVALSLMAMAVVFVLLIACVNVANLTMARGAVRDREIAVRMAMGASRTRVVRQLLVEGAMLASLAAGTGLLVARGTFLWLVAVTRGRAELFLELRIDPAMTIFAAALALATPLVFALLPALRGSRSDLRARLGEGVRGQSSGPRQRRLRDLLVVGQVTLALTLLIVSSLAVRSVIALVSIEPGFDPSSTLTMWLDTRDTDSAAEDSELRALHTEIVRAAGDVPGVDSAAVVSRRPFIGGQERVAYLIDGMPEPTEADTPRSTLTRVSSGFLDVTRVPLESGRAIELNDDSLSLPVVVVNRAARERYWSGRDPVGDVIRVNREAWPALRVVGVVGDLRNPDADQPPEPALYVSLDQFPVPNFALMTRVRSNAEDHRNAIVAAVRGGAPGIPVEDVRTMEQVLHDDLSGDMAIISLFTFFALVALGLATVGIYSVIAYTVNGRLREIGIRMALGARTPDVRRMVLRQGLMPVGIGIAFGLTAAAGISQLITGALYGVTPTDPVTFIGAPSLFVAVAILACLLPARRAAGVDPVESLRNE
ncbi:MAG: FtsX-like permease family protein [Acidobacteria bacterium]|nr:FtsX-like permease family protein [Acidobacteriota bacterium]